VPDVKAGLEKDKACLLVVVAGLRDGRKVVLAVESGYRECWNHKIVNVLVC
jgi:putative transposase